MEKSFAAIDHADEYEEIAVALAIQCQKLQELLTEPTDDVAKAFRATHAPMAEIAALYGQLARHAASAPA